VSALVLIGPSGAGKTTVGRRLADRLWVDFADTDQLVEAESGQSVGELFATRGEAAFRAAERRAAAAALAGAADQAVVIALGGGAPMDSATAQAMTTAQATSAATVVFLDVSEAVALRRVGAGAVRPLLAASPRQSWRALMAKRRPVYETLADVTINVDRLSPDQAADAIAQAIVKGDQ
jgi:shikimate kinase